MKTVQQMVDNFRERIKQTSDDSVFSDSFLYDILLSVRNDMLVKHLNNRYVLNESLWKKLCIPLCVVNSYECSCSTISIHSDKILRSKYKIPNYIVGNYDKYIKVRLIDNKTTISFGDTVTNKFIAYRPSNSPKYYCFIDDDYLYIVGYPNNMLKAVNIYLILTDPRDALLVRDCSDEQSICYDSNTDLFQIDVRFEDDLFNKAIQSLGLTLQLPDDVSNNSDSTIRKY